MSRITVIGGTGYAGAAIVAEAAGRDHQVTSLSRSEPAAPVAGVTYRQGDVADDVLLSSVIDGAESVVAALAPRGALPPEEFRDINRRIAALADSTGATLFVVGGFSSLRPAPGADRFVTDLSQVPAELHGEILAGAAVVMDDLPATPDSLRWVFVSPALGFGAQAPSEPTGHYRLGDEVAVDPTGGAISAADYALGVVDLIESDDHQREQVNLGV